MREKDSYPAADKVVLLPSRAVATRRPKTLGRRTRDLLFQQSGVVEKQILRFAQDDNLGVGQARMPVPTPLSPPEHFLRSATFWNKISNKYGSWFQVAERQPAPARRVEFSAVAARTACGSAGTTFAQTGGL